MHIKNNVHVSGKVLAEEMVNCSTTRLKVGILVSGKELPVTVDVPIPIWESFKNRFPNRYQSISVSGLLSTEKADGNIDYKVEVLEPNSISCFHDILAESLNETQTTFFGPVMLKKKFDFDTESKLYLKRMIFETAERCGQPTTFEAVALRAVAPCFDEINEGDKMLLKANFVLDQRDDGYPPYWKISHRPQLV